MLAVAKCYLDAKMSNGPQNKTQGVKGCDQLQGYSTTLSTGALRRVTGDIPFRLWIVASIGFWERAAFWGLTAPWRKHILFFVSKHLSNLINLSTRKLHATLTTTYAQ